MNNSQPYDTEHFSKMICMNKLSNFRVLSFSDITEFKSLFLKITNQNLRKRNYKYFFLKSDLLERGTLNKSQMK